MLLSLILACFYLLAVIALLYCASVRIIISAHPMLISLLLLGKILRISWLWLLLPLFLLLTLLNSFLNCPTSLLLLPSLLPPLVLPRLSLPLPSFLPYNSQSPNLHRCQCLLHLPPFLLSLALLLLLLHFLPLSLPSPS